MKISKFQQDMASIKQGDKSTTECFTRLCVLWDELKSYRPDPICACNPKCSCDTLSNVLERRKQDHVMQFLRGLNGQFSTIKSTILMMDPLPSIARFSHMQYNKKGKLTTIMH